MTIDMLKAKIAAMPRLFPDRNGMLNVEENKPSTFFVLCEEYSSKGYWVHPCGVHWENKKQIVCSEAGPCAVCERIRKMETQGFSSDDIFPIRGPLKYGMNILVRGEESPRVFLAPRTVGEVIIRTWESILNEENLNIFDHMASTAITVSRSKQAGETRYQVDFDSVSHPIVTGPNAEERIERILRKAANLDERFKLPPR